LIASRFSLRAQTDLGLRLAHCGRSSSTWRHADGDWRAAPSRSPLPDREIAPPSPGRPDSSRAAAASSGTTAARPAAVGAPPLWRRARPHTTGPLRGCAADAAQNLRHAATVFRAQPRHRHRLHRHMRGDRAAAHLLLHRAGSNSTRPIRRETQLTLRSKRRANSSWS